MIFHRDLVTCNDFSDCTTRLPLQASSADGQFVAIMYGVVGGCSCALPTRTLLILLLMVARENQGLEVMNVPNDAIADIISLVQICFGPVSVSF
jgi:hypothetical protein